MSNAASWSQISRRLTRVKSHLYTTNPTHVITPVLGDLTQVGSSLANSNTAVKKRGWVRMIILEQFDIPATEVYASLKFWQDNGSNTVSGGHDAYASCWHSPFPVWTTEDCFASQYPHAPDYVWIDVTGEYHHTLNIDYTMYAKFHGTAHGYSYQCDLIEGALPILWEEDCAGGKVAG